MSTELILAAVAGGDLCLQYGKRLVDMYKAFADADNRIKERALIIEAICTKTALQVEFVKPIVTILEETHCRVYLETLEMLKSKLVIATAKIESVVEKKEIKKLKYAFMRKSLDETIVELERWQSIFDPTWFLIVLVKNKAVDQSLLGAAFNKLSTSPTEISPLKSSTPQAAFSALRKLREVIDDGSDTRVHVSLPEGGLNWQNATTINYSTTRLIERTGSNRTFVVDSISCESSENVAQVRADAELLAKKLKQVDPETFNLLTCRGLVKRRNPRARQISSIELVFQLPFGPSRPTSLREQLLSCRKVGLSSVLNIAQQLAKAVSFVHTCDFVHKNIRPETILLFPNNTDSELGSAFLLGFDCFRSTHFHTIRSGDAIWERNIYRHPMRQGTDVRANYTMQHDIYSLGVCLLEIGLWISFICYQPDHGNNAASPSAELGLTFDDLCFTDNYLERFVKIKDHLIAIAKFKLPMTMGEKYTGVVISCLACLDERDNSFGGDEDLWDEDGILIGARFIERVLFRLGEISL